MKKKWLTLVFGSALFLAACGGGDDDKKDSTSGDTSGDKAGDYAVPAGKVCGSYDSRPAL